MIVNLKKEWQLQIIWIYRLTTASSTPTLTPMFSYEHSQKQESGIMKIKSELSVRTHRGVACSLLCTSQKVASFSKINSKSNVGIPRTNSTFGADRVLKNNVKCIHDKIYLSTELTFSSLLQEITQIENLNTNLQTCTSLVNQIA